MLLWLLAILVAAFALPASAQQTPVAPFIGAAKVVLDRDRCEALAGARFKELKGAPTWVIKASYVAATDQRQALCSVGAYVNPTNNFGLYLPIDKWNGRFVARGCGGSCGVVVMELVCAPHMRDGDACLASDMGHSSSIIDNNWTGNNLQGLVDFGYRSTHVTAVAGKAIAAAFYARPPGKSYFYGCSTGGRQALIEAQRFPEDFDGIVAVAPASLAPYGSKQAASVSEVDAFNTRPDGSPILPNRKAMLIHRAVVRACDGNDGVRDGLIGDPRRCRWKPEDLACTGASARDCLTPDQIAMLDKLYGWRGAAKGSELNWIGNYIRNAPLPGEGWTPIADLAVGRGDPATIESMVNPNNPDLRPFRDRGGKLILVQGWADQSVMPPPTIDYYETVVKTMDGPAATAEFARLFMVPGMDHCAGGEGASAIDYMGAISAWVEGGKAPDALRGVHPLPGAPLDFYGIGVPHLDPKYVAFARDHRAYPGASVAVGRDVRASTDTRSLDLRLADAVAEAEKTATAASFPRRSVLNAIAKGMWELFYHADSSADEQAAALKTVATRPLSPVAQEAVARMQGELTLD